MNKMKIWDSIKQIASILESVYSIFLIVSIAISLFIQIYPNLFQQWVIEFVKILTPIFVSILVIYVATRRMQASFQEKIEKLSYSIYERQRLINEFNTTHSQVLMFSLTASLKKKAKLEDFEILFSAVKKLDELWSNPDAEPLFGVPPTSFLGIAIDVAKGWDIPFEKFASFLVEKFGKERAKELVDSSDILRTFGKDCLQIWNELTR